MWRTPCLFVACCTFDHRSIRTVGRCTVLSIPNNFHSEWSVLAQVVLAQLAFAEDGCAHVPSCASSHMASPPFLVQVVMFSRTLPHVPVHARTHAVTRTGTLMAPLHGSAHCAVHDGRPRQHAHELMPTVRLLDIVFHSITAMAKVLGMKAGKGHACVNPCNAERSCAC